MTRVYVADFVGVDVKVTLLEIRGWIEILRSPEMREREQRVLEMMEGRGDDVQGLHLPMELRVEGERLVHVPRDNNEARGPIGGFVAVTEPQLQAWLETIEGMAANRGWSIAEDEDLEIQVVASSTGPFDGLGPVLFPHRISDL